MGLFDFLKRKPAAAAPPPEAPAQNLDPREHLIREVEAVLRADAANEKVARHPEQYGFSVERGGTTRHIFLNNLFAETRELSPEQRQQKILYFLSSFTETLDESWEDVVPMLRLVVRASTANVLVDPTGELLTPMVRPFLPGLNTLVAVDRPTSMAYVSAKQLETWSVSEDDAFRSAEKNLGKLPAGAEVYDRTHGPVFTLTEGDDYAASRLLVPGWLASFQGKVEGRPLAIIPERSTVLVGGDAKPELVRWLTERAQREFESANRRVTPAVYTVVDDSGSVIPYVRAGKDELAYLVRRGHAGLAAREYAEQKAVLDEHHKKKNIDLFVATCTLALLKDGKPFTYCVWPDGIDALLPRTDLVAIVGGTPNTPSAWNIMVPFSKAMDIGGALQKDAAMNFGPKRTRVSGKFSEAQRKLFKNAEGGPETLP